MIKKYFVLRVNNKGLFDIADKNISFETVKSKYPKSRRLYE